MAVSIQMDRMRSHAPRHIYASASTRRDRRWRRTRRRDPWLVPTVLVASAGVVLGAAELLRTLVL